METCEPIVDSKFLQDCDSGFVIVVIIDDINGNQMIDLRVPAKIK